MPGLRARGSLPPTAAATEPAASPGLDGRTALLASPDARRMPTWQPLAALLAACRDDPARFQAEVLGRTLWDRQVAVCAAAARSPITDVNVSPSLCASVATRLEGSALTVRARRM